MRMFSFRKVSTPALAALLMVTLPWSACAVETVAKPAQKKQSKEQTKKETKQGSKKAAKKVVKKVVKPEAKKETKETSKQETKTEVSKEVKQEVKTSPDDIMVRVNGTAITRLEVDRAVKVMLAQNQIEQPLEPEVMKQAEAAALEQLTSAELLYQEAAKLEVPDLDKQVAEKVAQNRAKFSTDAEFEQALNGVNMTAKDMQDFTRKDILIGNFVEQRFAANAQATEAEARIFYDENLDKFFKKPETAKASHILIGSAENASAEERAKAKEKAEALLKRVKAGEDFAALAKSDSSCPSSAQGGDLGSFGRGDMVPAFEQAAFALKPGEVSEVVETQFGYHIVKLTEKQEATTESFDNVKGKITEFLKREKVQKQLSEFVDEQRKSAKIEQK
jgi:peptidyl-prolyl cis-trans isomerase C